MSMAEILGFITGAWCVLLAVRESVWNWPIGIANNIFFLLLFWHSRLYADALLQVFYVAIALYGWWLWLYGGLEHSELSVTKCGGRNSAMLLAATAISTMAIYWALHAYTDSNVPLGDATTTALSLAAQYMLGKKWIENWAVWIVADVIYIALYWYKHLYLTAGLYAVFIAMCVAGYMRWRRSTEARPLEATQA